MQFKSLTTYVHYVAALFVWANTSISFGASWEEKSNKVAERFTKEYSALVPELGSSVGYREFESKGQIVDEKWDARQKRFFSRWKSIVEEELAKAKDKNVLLDLHILKDVIDRSLRGLDLDRKYNVIPVERVSQSVYSYLQMLINPQSDVDRKKSAVDRFLAYAKENKSQLSFAAGNLKRIKVVQSEAAGKKLFYPLKQSIEQYLDQSPDFVKGVKSLLEKSGRTDWEQAFASFKKQVEEYDNFLKTAVLPKARTTLEQPAELYAHLLKEKGITMPPSELVKIARTDYKSVYKKFSELAENVAKKRKLSVKSPAKVIGHLKHHQVTNPDDVKTMYQNADRRLAKIIKKNDLVSLPTTPLKIRVADPVESKAAPVPHLTQPPLVGNTGERPEFVVPSAGDGELPFDDFSFEAAALILTAHEGRPGHDLQFSTMLDNGVSIIRARYALNSANVEGWGLYAEDLVYPYIPEESQLIALQTRLWRIARMFLDPEVNLGKADKDAVVDLFVNELGVSKEMAQLEFNRYAFRDPGQAGAYYFGLLELRKALSEAKSKVGKKFKLKCFNDAVLEVGALPIRLVTDEIVKGSDCSNMSI